MKQTPIDLEKRLKDLEKQLSDPSCISNHSRYVQLSNEYARTKEIRELQINIDSTRKDIEDTKELLKSEDNDIADMASLELDRLNDKLSKDESKLTQLLKPKNPNDSKNAILEIRAGSGGEEAALFAADLYRMYVRYAEENGWVVEQMNMAHTGAKGVKEVIALIKGNNVYGRLKYESGVHRVQRIPITESSGRIHTSAASVAILPEVEDVEIELNQADLKIDVYRSSGPGGQSVNTTDSAVRITHIPSGLVVTCQDSKSQHQNKDRAIKVLKSRLFQIEMNKQHSQIDAKRKEAVSTGDRSAKIRTYNFPQDRVTDHRIKKSWFGIEKIMDGDIDKILDEIQDQITAEENSSNEATTP